MTRRGQRKAVAHGTNGWPKNRAPFSVAVLFPRVLHRGKCPRNRDGASTHKRLNTAAVFHADAYRTVTTLGVREAGTRNRNVAVDRYWVAARGPHSDVRTASHGTYTRFGIHSQQRCSKRAVNCVAACGCNLTRRVGGKLRC